jgi:hypothetical protein
MEQGLGELMGQYLSCVAIFMSLALQQDLSPIQVWPDALSSIARARIKADATQEPTGPRSSSARNSGTLASRGKQGVEHRSADPYPFSPEDIEGINAHHLARGRAMEDAGRFLDDGLPVLAKARIESYLITYPWDDVVVPLLSDALFRLGMDAAAYELLAPRADRWAAPDLLLRASLAAAKRGEVYSGQKEYCVNVLAGGTWAEMRQAIVQSSVPTGTSPSELVLLSYLALGAGVVVHVEDRSLSYYLGKVLEMDSLNPLANRCLGDFHLRNHRYPQAVNAYERALVRARDPMKRIIQRQLETARYLRDN